MQNIPAYRISFQDVIIFIIFCAYFALSWPRLPLYSVKILFCTVNPCDLGRRFCLCILCPQNSLLSPTLSSPRKIHRIRNLYFLEILHNFSRKFAIFSISILSMLPISNRGGIRSFLRSPEFSSAFTLPTSTIALTIKHFSVKHEKTAPAPTGTVFSQITLAGCPEEWWVAP